VSAKERQEMRSPAHEGTHGASSSGTWPRRAFAATRCISGAAAQDTRYAAAHCPAFLVDARFSPRSQQCLPRTQPQMARYDEAPSAAGASAAAAAPSRLAQNNHQG
jgi:hypothetical protein